jgi:putative Holliday junction resolvase
MVNWHPAAEWTTASASGGLAQPSGIRRILGLDVGDRRIGVALSDPLGLTAQPLTVLTRRDLARDVADVRALVEQHAVGGIVVGLPLTLRGEPEVQARKVMTFIKALRRHVAVPVRAVDERLTTVQGARALRDTGVGRRRRKALIDQVAAQLILQQVLDAQRDAT